MRRIVVVACISLPLAYAAVAQDAPPVPGDGKVPQDISSRVYVRDTSSYEISIALGKLGELDRQTNVITTYVDVSHFRCDPTTALRSKVNQMPNTTAYSFTLDKDYSGSISVFTANAQLSDKERQRVIVDDVASVDLQHECQLNRQSIARLLSTMPGVQGKTIYYVTGATMSHLMKEVYSESDWGGGVSAGSWLSVSAKGYKGSGKIDNVPVVSVRGYYIEVPKERSKILSAIEDGSVPLISFSTATDLRVPQIRNSLTSTTPQ